uniref:Protein FAM160A1-like n=1 Tax=Phallusia mammillata TaxID=59560 RepID=A0A6F9DCC9_9ASCI|nr:protein FAM160A1-like [Phallusia mammillata]
MSWLKKLKKWDDRPSQEQTSQPAVGNPETICLDAFKSHWQQICDIISATCPRPAFIQTKETVVPKIENITSDDVNVVRNLLEHMIYLLVEEQSSGQLLGPILEFAITQNIFQKLLNWWDDASLFKTEIMLNLLKVYEVLISQAQHSLLHHKQLVSPMLKLLSCSTCTRSEELDAHIVLLLNLLCVWMNRDPTLLEVFFNASSAHGSANFVIFSLLIDFIHREGTIGQQARDALLLCMSLSSENESVANYIVHQSNFCPVLATGLSALYSTLPRHMVVRTDDWHCLQRSDWSQVPSLINFMNSFEFCNSVIEVAHSIVGEQLLDFFYNGFLISVFSPSLHKTSADEVVVTTAYLNLFLRSVTAPPLMRCFLQFLLTHRHESSLIINTLIQRIASNNRLALVSLSLIRTLADLNCEDLMLQLVFRHLIPCEHLLVSQRRAICDVDLHNASAARFLALTPAACLSEPETKPGTEVDMFRPVQDEPNAENKIVPVAEEKPVSPAPASPVSPGNVAFHSLQPPSPPHDTSFSFRGNKSPPAIDANCAFSEYTVNEDLSVTINMHSAVTSEEPESTGMRLRTITSPSTMAEFGPDLKSQLELNTSYMDYLEDARNAIHQCSEACEGWSAPYDGVNPPPDPIEEQNSPVSRSTPVLNRKSESETKKDPITTEAPDTAMRALSATMQALDLTALAMNGNTTLPDSPVAVTNPTIPPVQSREELPVENVTDNVSAETVTKNKDVNENVKLAEQENVIPPMDLPILSSEDVTSSQPIVENHELQSPTTEKLTKPHSGSVGQASSVDDFFRSLMDIVPKSTREKVESGKLLKQTSNAVNPDEDIESGIEVSSDGDVQNTSPERNLNDEICGESQSQQNEDTMSQVSVNTADMDDEDPIKNLPAPQHSREPPSPHDAGEELSFNHSRNYSFADETDDEFDDSASIASSSFYEPHDDYIPTELSVAPALPLKLQGIPYTGPLMGTLFAKLDQMINNSLYENLLLTGIVTRLACYPQPLLRSFLLNTQMVFHPSVRSLYQVLNSARNKIDTYAAQIGDFRVLVRRAQKYLLARGTIPLSGDARTRNTVQDRPMPVPKIKTRTFGDMFMRRKPKDKKKGTLLPRLETLLERRGRTKSKDSDVSADAPQEGANQTASQFYVKQSMRQREREERKLRELRTKNAVYASIVLAEFLKELAAVAQEHAVAYCA